MCAARRGQRGTDFGIRKNRKTAQAEAAEADAEAVPLHLEAARLLGGDDVLLGILNAMDPDAEDNSDLPKGLIRCTAAEVGIFYKPEDILANPELRNKTWLKPDNSPEGEAAWLRAARGLREFQASLRKRDRLEPTKAEAESEPMPAFNRSTVLKF